MKVPDNRSKPVGAEAASEAAVSHTRPAKGHTRVAAPMLTAAPSSALQALARKRAPARKKSGQQREASSESADKHDRGGEGLTASGNLGLRGPRRRTGRDAEGDGRDGEGGQHQHTEAPKARRATSEAATRKKSRRKQCDESPLGAVDGLAPPEAAPAAAAAADAASHLTELLLLASRHAQRLHSSGLSPLQIQLLAVRQYLGLSDPGETQFMLSDVKALLLERQSDNDSLAPADTMPASTVEQNRNALLPLMLLNTLQRRNRPTREQARDKIDLIVDLKGRTRG